MVQAYTYLILEAWLRVLHVTRVEHCRTQSLAMMDIEKCIDSNKHKIAQAC